jgi:hypothetical protein
MQLRAPEPPATAAAAVRETLRAFAEGARFRTDALRGAEPGALALDQPHEVFVLGLDDLASDRPLERARPVGWRYLVQDGDRVIAAAESTVDPETGDHVFSSFNEGPFVTSTAAAFAVVKADRDVVSDRFEPRLLHVPALHAMALWLHAADGADDRLVPLSPFPLEVSTGEAVPASELVRRLAELAGRTGADAVDDTKGS